MKKVVSMSAWFVVISMMTVACAPAATPAAVVVAPTDAPNPTVSVEIVPSNTPLPTVTLVPASGIDLTQKEAPLLADQVAAGKLPPLADRLPKVPLVVESPEGPGTYGGTWTIGSLSIRGTYKNQRTISEGLMMWDRTGSNAVPSVAKSVDISPDFSTYTFHLREGMKWSDGAAYTSEDILFYFNDLVFNPEFIKSPYGWVTPGGKIPSVTAPDAVTVVFKFSGPYGLFLQNMAYQGIAQSNYPKHYFVKFHPSYTDKALVESTIKTLGFVTWPEAVNSLANSVTVGLPRLSAWVNTTDKITTTALYIRNPYYFKVDTAGRQLPYMDEMKHFIYQDKEVMLLAALNGDFTYEAQVLSPVDFVILSENQDRGGYKVYRYPRTTPMAAYFNQDCPDPVMGPLVRDVRFRRALSIGVDRQDINDSAFLGLGVITQALPAQSDPYSMPELLLKDTEYDPDAANALLDEIGLVKRDADNFRMTSAGQRVKFTLPVLGGEGVGDRAYKILGEYWNELGLDVTVKFVDGDTFNELNQSGKMAAVGYLSDTLQWQVDPYAYVPNLKYNFTSTSTGAYYESGGKEGVAPTPLMKELVDTYDAMVKTGDPAEQVKLGRHIVQMHSDNLWVIGFVNGFQPVIANAKFHNIAHDTGSETWQIYFPRYMQPEQWWLEK